VPVLKTGDLARGPRVQISPPPPIFNNLGTGRHDGLARKFRHCNRKSNLFFLNVAIQPLRSFPKIPSLVMLYRSNTDRVFCPLIFIATVSGTPARTKFRTPVRRRS
jgi:hypothetical protein